MKLFSAVVGSALLVAAGTGAATSRTTVVRSGLHGFVTRGPVTPLCTAEEPCTKPASGAVLVFSRSGKVVARAPAQQDGAYRITLPTGTYEVRTASLRPLEPQAAQVIAAHYRRVDFSIDTGIR